MEVFETLLIKALSNLVWIQYWPCFAQEPGGDLRGFLPNAFMLWFRGSKHGGRCGRLEGLFLCEAGKLWSPITKTYRVCKHVQKRLTRKQPCSYIVLQRTVIRSSGMKIQIERGRREPPNCPVCLRPWLGLDLGCHLFKLLTTGIFEKFLDAFHYKRTGF